MPTHMVTTKRSQSVWKSPDGQREIFEVILDYDGSEVKVKTYSRDISGQGWTGEVETYEKEGRNGSETFVKQPAKEGGYGGGNKGGYTPRDDSHIKAQWAIGQAVGMINDVTELDKIEALATELFVMVDRVKQSASIADEPVVDTVIEEVPDGQLTLEDIKSVFPGAESEGKWKKD